MIYFAQPVDGGPVKIGTSEWGRWLADFAKSQGNPVSDVVEQGVALLAKRLKFRPPPDRV